MDHLEEFHPSEGQKDGFFITEANDMSRDELHGKKSSRNGQNPFSSAPITEEDEYTKLEDARKNAA
jgi:hypothetical protein